MKSIDPDGTGCIHRLPYNNQSSEWFSERTAVNCSYTGRPQIVCDCYLLKLAFPLVLSASDKVTNYRLTTHIICYLFH